MTDQSSPSTAAGAVDQLAMAMTPWWPGEAVPMAETRADLSTALDMDEAWEAGYFTPGRPSAGALAAGPEAALRIATVFACRRAIAEDVAKLPINLVEVTKDRATGRRKTRKVDDHPVARLIDGQPNHWMTPFQFIEYMVGTAAVHGEAYAYINRDDAGRPVELLPFLPGAVSVTNNDLWELTYTYRADDGMVTEPDGRDLFKLHGPMHTPLRAFAVSQVAREAIGLARAIESAASRFHRNDLRPSGVLTTKRALDDKILSRIRTDWKANFGPGGSGGVAILDNEFEFKAMTATSTDAQSLDNRKFPIEEICRFMRVVPTLIGHNNGSQSYGSVEQQMISHVNHTLHPWVVRLEQAFQRDLLDPRDDYGIRVKIDMDALMRGTFGDRMNAYGNATKVLMTPNEAREREGMDALDDPAMDRVQLQANNTGLKPDGAAPADKTKTPPAKTDPAKTIPQPQPAA